MKKLRYLIHFLILALMASCQYDHNLIGNYSICENGEYSEVYIKKDSIRIAADNEWIKLSEWRKIKVVKDTLYFKTFGEWRDYKKAKIIYIGKGEIQLNILKSGETLYLSKIDEKLNFEKPEKFWMKFKERQSLKKCN